MRAVDVARKLCPRAKPAYIAAFEEADPLLAAYGVTTPLRLAHFLAQACHETGGLTILRESGSYSAPRILDVFGAGRHSAAVTAAEAGKLAGNGPALFERVYGLGNPKMAGKLGNIRKGDGWRYRGNGILQTTGRQNHRRMGEQAGLGPLFEDDPDMVTDAAYALIPALAEWKSGGCNALADTDDILAISRVINLGNARSKAMPNGLANRKAWFAKISPLLADGVTVADAGHDRITPATPGASGAQNHPAPAAIDPSDGLSGAEIRALQQRLRDLGYTEVGFVDGRMGDRTRTAIGAFQVVAALPMTGVLDTATAAALTTAGPRPVSAERAHVTAAMLKAQGDKVVAATDAIKTVVATVATPAAVVGILDQVGVASDKLALVRAVLGEVPGAVWALVVLTVAVTLWLAAQRAQAAKIEAVRTGRDAGPG